MGNRTSKTGTIEITGSVLSDVRAVPNPAKGIYPEIWFTVGQNNVSVKITVWDISGTEIGSKEIMCNIGSQSVDLEDIVGEDIASGIYIYGVRAEGPETVEVINKLAIIR